MRKGQVEILAPAGSFESMKAAIGAGADAVYIGGSRFGARAYADNLDQEKMLEAIDYAHIHGVSLYMTVNTLMKEEELRELPRFLEPYYKQGLDAVIVQDLGAVGIIRKFFPDIPVHASTQMTITGVYGARILSELGVKRVVTARELSLEEIRRIHDEVPIEIECFVHGALCYCYSGQCLLSSFIGGRSGNRGRCAQPCRLPYGVRETKEAAETHTGGREGKAGRTLGKRRESRLSRTGGTGRDSGAGQGPETGGNAGGGRRKAAVWDGSYLLSMKDLCTLDLIPDLIEAGIDSLKIEGRMKSPRYTAGVVRAYRRYVDRYLEKGREGYHVNPADRQELLDLFDRGGFTEGYYRQHNGRDMIALAEKPAFRQGNQNLFDELDRLYVETEKKEPVEGILTVREGQETCLELCLGKTSGDGKEALKVTVWGQKAETAKNQPAAKEQLARQIKKTGGTPFEWTKLDVCLEGQAFVPVQALNELRRQGLEQLRRRITDGYRRTCPGWNEEQDISGTGIREKAAAGGGQERRSKPEIHVLLSTNQGFSQVMAVPEVSRVVAEADGIQPKMWKTWSEQCHIHNKSCFLAMPVIFRKQAEDYFDRNLSLLLEAGFDGILVRALEEIEYLRDRGVKTPVYGDYNLYVFNSAAQDMLMRLGCEGITLPLELNGRELGRFLAGRRELIGYGFLPAMVSAQCVRKNLYGCSRQPGRLMMRDRMGKELPVENHCAYCYNIIYNPSPLSLIDQSRRILELDLEAVRLQFTWESPEEIRQVVTGWVKKIGEPEKENSGYEEDDIYQANDFTRGHFRRGVE